MSAADNQFDAEANETILGCLNLEALRSFSSMRARALAEHVRL